MVRPCGLLQFFFDDTRDLLQRLLDIARQASLRHIRTSPTFAADAGDEIARLESALDEILGHYRDDG